MNVCMSWVYIPRKYVRIFNSFDFVFYSRSPFAFTFTFTIDV